MSARSKQVEAAYALARERYGALGVNVDRAVRTLRRVAISLHCWQGDDVAGFEGGASVPGGGLAVTGSYPGRARNADELRSDIDLAMSLIPGTHRLNLHASYAETLGEPVDRNELEPAHFAGWIDWARERRVGLDFNPTFFGHPRAADGATLSHPDRGIRRFWIEHGVRCREIGKSMGAALGTPCVTNVWIPDGSKDTPVDRRGPRERLEESLDAVFAKRMDPRLNRDAVESKLFGIGSESYVVGSHEFYLGYAMKNRKLLCLDAGHFHPTESVADKISSVLQWLPEILLHVSRGVRWDSDHVVILSDDVEAIAQEVVRGGFLDRVHVGLDFFDASINRIAAWVVGSRCMIKALLLALLEPSQLLKKLEADGDLTGRLVLLEELRTQPFGAVWDHYCRQMDVPLGEEWLNEVRGYERKVLSRR